MPTINATPKDANANSYLTVAEATDYFDAISTSKYNLWIGSTEQERHLIRATKIVDAHFNFIGQRTTKEQALEWPRDFVFRDGIYTDEYYAGVGFSSDPFVQSSSPWGYPAYSEWYRYLLVNGFADGDIQLLDKDTVPEAIKEATAEVALTLEQKAQEGTDLFASSDQSIQTEKVDVIQVSYFEPNKYMNVAQGVIPPEALPKLEKYGHYLVNPATPGYSGTAGLA